MLFTKSCTICEGKFETEQYNQVTCSSECRISYINRNDAIRHRANGEQKKDCIQCSKPFLAGKNQKICSDECRQIRKKTQMNEWLASQDRETINSKARESYARSQNDRKEKANARRRDPENNARINEAARKAHADKGRIRKQMSIYGVSRERAIELLAQTTCEICNEETKLHTDHCHATGMVRGRLCNNCNNGLGRFKDNVALLEAAVKYLKGEKDEVYKE